MFRAGLYARVSTDDQQTIPLQIRALREYVVRRGWTIALQVKEVGSGATAATKAGEVRALRRAGISKAAIARRLHIGRTSVRRILG
jgi:DNA invertase Pin-like site-specific DNA recombinase